MKKIALDDLLMGLGLGGTAGLLMSNKLGLYVANLFRPKTQLITVHGDFKTLQQDALQLIISMKNKNGTPDDCVLNAWEMGCTIFRLIAPMQFKNKTLREYMQSDRDLEGYVDVLAPTHTRYPGALTLVFKRVPDVKVAELAKKLKDFNTYVTGPQQTRTLVNAAELVKYTFECMAHYLSLCSDKDEGKRFKYKVQKGGAAEEMWNAWAHYYDAQLEVYKPASEEQPR